MFLAIVFIILGLFMLLSAMGIVVGNFWGFFWAFFFLAIGIRMMMKRGMCPVCGWHHWEGKMHGKMHEKMYKHCGCGDEHEHHEGEDEKAQ
jgi:hypothetical protein